MVHRWLWWLCREDFVTQIDTGIAPWVFLPPHKLLEGWKLERRIRPEPESCLLLSIEGLYIINMGPLSALFYLGWWIESNKLCIWWSWYKRPLMRNYDKAGIITISLKELYIEALPENTSTPRHRWRW
jgi:hypothetical protein